MKNYLFALITLAALLSSCGSKPSAKEACLEEFHTSLTYYTSDHELIQDANNFADKLGSYATSVKEYIKLNPAECLDLSIQFEQSESINVYLITDYMLNNFHPDSMVNKTFNSYSQRQIGGMTLDYIDKSLSFTQTQFDGDLFQYFKENWKKDSIPSHLLDTAECTIYDNMVGLNSLKKYSGALNSSVIGVVIISDFRMPKSDGNSFESGSIKGNVILINGESSLVYCHFPIDIQNSAEIDYSYNYEKYGNNRDSKQEQALLGDLFLNLNKTIKQKFADMSKIELSAVSINPQLN